MRTRLTGTRRRRWRGFTLVEVMLVTSMMMTILATFAVGIRAGHAATEEMQRRSVLTVMSGDLMDRLYQINFGTVADPDASEEQLTELFDDDDVLGSISLSSMRVAPGVPGHSFQLANFEYGGNWEVRVTGDLNNDGDEDDSLEGREDLMRIDILYNGSLVLETIRTAPLS